MNKPAENVRLSAEEGEALIVRVHQSNLSADDASAVEWMIRMYFWVAFALQEAKLSVKRLRDVLFGSRRTPKTPLESEASASSSDELVQGEGEGEFAPVAEASPGFEAAGCAGGAGTCESEASPKPKGGHRAGTGRLGADAYEGAERVECRHEE